jgi:hypothetical protein
MAELGRLSRFGFDRFERVRSFSILSKTASIRLNLSSAALFSRSGLVSGWYARSLAKLRVDLSDCPRFAASRLAELTEQDFTQLVRYLVLGEELRKKFGSIPEVHYGATQHRIEDLVTVHMTYLLDGQVIDFYENQRNTAKALRDIIRAKEQFPKEEFGKLRQAFPCILAGIRDYAEYIPLEPEIFDLLIIDEASQVSIAQALPALLRARKILILGDKKQFSNVKAVQARSDTNREYLNRLETSFRRHVSQETTKLVKVDRFNIRTSVLEFFEFISQPGEGSGFRIAPPALEQNGTDDDQALDHLLGISRDVHEVHDIADDPENEHAQKSLKGSSLAAGEPGSANHHRGDGIQFRAGAYNRRSDTGAAGADDSSDCAEGAGNAIHRKFVPSGPNPGQPDRTFVAADGGHHSSKHRVAQQKRH